MTKKQFSIKKAFSYAWETFKKNWQLFLVISIISAVLRSPQQLVERLAEINPFYSLIGLVISIISILVSIGILKVTLRVFDKEKPEILDIFQYSRYFWRYIGAGILYGLLVGAGLILLIVPGIIWAIKYSMTLSLIVDKDMDIIGAFKKSAELTSGIKWRLFVFGLACIGVFILGGLALGVGILVATPVVWLASVFVYRHLLNMNTKE